MAHSYRKLQQWDNWLSHQSLGEYVLTTECNQLSYLLKNHFGKQVLLIGVPAQQKLMKASNLVFQYLLSPLHQRNNPQKLADIESTLDDLPILTGSVDLVLLPHTLEFIDHPRKLLAEACRIVRPEGLIAICGFNPYSTWGIKKVLTSQKKDIPWSGNFFLPKQIRQWLQLADFQIEKYTQHLCLPPISNLTFIHKMQWLENIGILCFPFFGGIYIVLARAKVIPLTPIRLKWKQQLNGIRISPTISGPLIR